MKTYEIYQSVTDSIIQLLEDQSVQYDKPWIALGQDNDYARNPFAQRYYNGINQFILSLIIQDKAYSKNIWATFHQIKTKGGHVRKGEKSTNVIFYKKTYFDKDNKKYTHNQVSLLSQGQQAAKGLQSRSMLKLYRVFNIAQTVDLAPDLYSIEEVELPSVWQKDEAAENMINATGAHIDFMQSNEAYYDRIMDRIVLPVREQFKGDAKFYEVVLHELGHWTGHEKRLSRTFGKFGTPEYAKEELIAELTSAFCCATLGFSKTISNNAAYIKNWLGVLKKDNKAIFKAAAAAQKASDYIFACVEGPNNHITPTTSFDYQHHSKG